MIFISLYSKNRNLLFAKCIIRKLFFRNSRYLFSPKTVILLMLDNPKWPDLIDCLLIRMHERQSFILGARGGSRSPSTLVWMSVCPLRYLSRPNAVPGVAGTVGTCASMRRTDLHPRRPPLVAISFFFFTSAWSLDKTHTYTHTHIDQPNIYWTI